jgi:hypothetical protein
MPKQNYKSHTKRKRELAKLDKRLAKDQKRALKRAESSPADSVVAAAAVSPPVAARGPVAAAPKPLTLAEAVERWKATKVVKANRR